MQTSASISQMMEKYTYTEILAMLRNKLYSNASQIDCSAYHAA